MRNGIELEIKVGAWRRVPVWATWLACLPERDDTPVTDDSSSSDKLIAMASETPMDVDIAESLVSRRPKRSTAGNRLVILILFIFEHS